MYSAADSSTGTFTRWNISLPRGPSAWPARLARRWAATFSSVRSGALTRRLDCLSERLRPGSDCGLPLRSAGADAEAPIAPGFSHPFMAPG